MCCYHLNREIKLFILYPVTFFVAKVGPRLLTVWIGTRQDSQDSVYLSGLIMGLGVLPNILCVRRADGAWSVFTSWAKCVALLTIVHSLCCLSATLHR